MRLLTCIAWLLRRRAAEISACVSVVSGTILLTLAPGVSAQDRYSEQMDRQRGHNSSQWMDLAEHLPNRLNSSAETLELQADILRVRRYPEDANAFYNYALQKGGERAVLLNKLGMTELNLRDFAAARSYFKRVISIDGKNPEGWNNLGVVEHVEGRLTFAIQNYQRAVRSDPSCAVFRANLAIALLDHSELNRARNQIDAALQLDPAIFETEGESADASARVVSSRGRTRLLLELARLYARRKDEAHMFRALAAAGEAGTDVRNEMRHDRILSTYLDDPRVVVLSRNSQLLQMLGEPDPTETPSRATGRSRGEL